MRKILLLTLAIIIAAISTACTGTSAEGDPLPDLKTGKYYFNGNTATEAYIEITENTVHMGGEKLADFWEGVLRDVMTDASDDKIAAEVEVTLKERTTVSEYVYTDFTVLDDDEYYILYSPTGDKVDKEAGMNFYYPINQNGVITIAGEYVFRLV